MGEAILDPFAYDPTLADLVRRVAMLEQQPKVTPPFLYTPIAQASSVAPDASWYAGHTNANFSDAAARSWSVPIARLNKVAVWCRIAWTTPAATTGEVKLQEFLSGAATSAVALAAGSSGTQTFVWLHNLPLWSAQLLFDVRVRRTGGAGTVLVQAPSFALVDPLGATLTGI